jgi:hypothetical protein
MLAFAAPISKVELAAMLVESFEEAGSVVAFLHDVKRRVLPNTVEKRKSFFIKKQV